MPVNIYQRTTKTKRTQWEVIVGIRRPDGRKTRAGWRLVPMPVELLEYSSRWSRPMGTAS